MSHTMPDSPMCSPESHHIEKAQGIPFVTLKVEYMTFVNEYCVDAGPKLLKHSIYVTGFTSSSYRKNRRYIEEEQVILYVVNLWRNRLYNLFCPFIHRMTM